MQMSCTDQTPEWIAQVVAQNPVQMVDEVNVRTCPVRLSFPNLFEPSAVDKDKEPNFNTVLLFPPAVDLSILQTIASTEMQKAFPEYLQNGQWLPGLEWPFKDQGTKAHKHDGYTNGSIFMSVSSKYRPAILDARMAPVIDPSRVYPGVWALAVLNPYTWNYNNMKRGCSFGIQTLMLLADDQKLGGGAIDANTAFAGVVAPAPQAPDIMPHGNVGAVVGVPPAAPMAPPQPLMPPQPAAPLSAPAAPAMAPPATAYAPPAAAVPQPAPIAAPAPAMPAAPVAPAAPGVPSIPAAPAAAPAAPMAPPPLPGQPA